MTVFKQTKPSYKSVQKNNINKNFIYKIISAEDIQYEIMHRVLRELSYYMPPVFFTAGFLPLPCACTTIQINGRVS